jgi:DNA-binding response OmpR family regulator
VRSLMLDPGGQTLPQTPALQKVIMVVDDSQTVRNILALIVHRLGHQIVRTRSAIEALSTLNEIVPDLIFLDITLPGMDGLDICKVIKGHERVKQIPVIILSGSGHEDDKVMGRLAGAADYITKPFEPETIRKCVETYCGLSDHPVEGVWQKP